MGIGGGGVCNYSGGFLAVGLRGVVGLAVGAADLARGSAGLGGGGGHGVLWRGEVVLGGSVEVGCFWWIFSDSSSWVVASSTAGCFRFMGLTA